MRVADKNIYGQVDSNLLKNRRKVVDLQQKMATQKRVTKPSDDPVSATSVLQTKRIDKESGQFLKNLETARSYINFTDQSLGEISDVLLRAKELVLGQVNSASSNPQARVGVATEIEQLHNQVVQVSNRRLGDRYIFGGFQTRETPFDTDGEYYGDSGGIPIEISKGTFLQMNLPGGAVFRGEDLMPDGRIKEIPRVPETVEDLQDYRKEQHQRKQIEVKRQRTLASLSEEGSPVVRQKTGTNLFATLKRVQSSLLTGDMDILKETIDDLDAGLKQVITARSQIGSKGATLDAAQESLMKNQIDMKALTSHHEDADMFKAVSDMSQAESTLKATLQTSSQMIQSSLLDFLR